MQPTRGEAAVSATQQTQEIPRNGSTPTRTKLVTWEDPVPHAIAGAGMRGIDYLRKIAAGEVPAPPISRLMGFGVTEASEGHAVFEVTPGEEHYNPIGVVHGGLAATLLDSAMGVAVHSTLGAGEGYTTLEIKVNFVRPMTRDTGPVRAIGEAVHVGRRTATAEARLEDANGKLLAHATCTCLIMRAEE
jgi:uncharacterized protein (TIGR00369 family)